MIIEPLFVASLLVSAVISEECSQNVTNKLTLSKDFIFGVYSSDSQTDGALNLSGRGNNYFNDAVDWKSPSEASAYEQEDSDIWDAGFGLHSITLSWKSISPKGTIDQFDSEALKIYSDHIEKIITKGLQPVVTLYHRDLPDILQNSGGWLNSSIVEHFENYSRFVFRKLGEKVKWWITIKNPFLTAMGYGSRQTPPAMNLHGFGEYQAAHNLLSAHARAYKIYRNEFDSSHRGYLGISLRTDYIYPDRDTEEGLLASEAGMQFTVGWFAHPLFSSSGDYPPMMRDYIDRNSAIEGLRQSRLPYFNQKEIQRIKGSYDFLAASHLTSVTAKFSRSGPNPSWLRDSGVRLNFSKHWQSRSCRDQTIVPDSQTKILQWLKDSYGNIPILIMESGYCSGGELNKEKSADFRKKYLTELAYSLEGDGVNTTIYCIRSPLDGCEWAKRKRQGLQERHFNDQFPSRKENSSRFFWEHLSNNF